MADNINSVCLKSYIGEHGQDRSDTISLFFDIHIREVKSYQIYKINVPTLVAAISYTIFLNSKSILREISSDTLYQNRSLSLPSIQPIMYNHHFSTYFEYKILAKYENI